MAPELIAPGVYRAGCTNPSEARRSAQKLLNEEFATAVLVDSKTLLAGAKKRAARGSRELALSGLE